MRRLVLAIAMAVALPVLAGCRNGSPDEGEARLSEGRADVARGSGQWKSVTGGVIRRGDRVRVVGGRAVLSLRNGGQLELRDGSLVRLGRTPVLEEGDLLVVPAARPVTVEAGRFSAAVAGGAARLARAVAFEAGSYAGSVEVSSPDRSVTVPALRQVVVSDAGAEPSVVPPRPSALVLRSPEDPWDRRFLGEWIDLGRDLESRSRGLTAQLPPGSSTTVSYYRLLLPGLEDQPAFSSLVDRRRASGETVVGAAIALEGRRGGFGDRWGEVFGFRDDGAAWGLVVLDQGVSAGAVTGRVEGALDRFVAVGREAALPPPPRRDRVSTTTARPAAGTTAAPTPGRATTTTTTSPGPRSPGDTTSPVPPTGVGPIDDTQAPLVETLVGLLRGVTDLVGLGAAGAAKV